LDPVFRRLLYHSISSCPSTPDQLDQFVNVQYPIYSKIKSFRQWDFIRNAEKRVFFSEKISFEAIWWVSATPPVQMPVQHRKLVQHNKQPTFLAASVKSKKKIVFKTQIFYQKRSVFQNFL
jgi:hypothetical protein